MILPQKKKKIQNRIQQQQQPNKELARKQETINKITR